MTQPATPRQVLRRGLLLLLGTCGLIGLLIGASLIHLHTMEPPCWVQEWRVPGPIGCNQVLWFFGPEPVRTLVYLAGAFVACLPLAWITLPLQHRRSRNSARR